MTQKGHTCEIIYVTSSEKTSDFDFFYKIELMLPVYRVAQELQFVIFYSSLKQRVRKLYPLVLALF